MGSLSFTPENDHIQTARSNLYDQRTGLDAPWVLQNALLALTQGSEYIAQTQTKGTSDGRIDWEVLAVVGRSIVLITANGPEEDEHWRQNHMLDVRNLVASRYPSSILTQVSCAPELAWRSLATTDQPVAPGYLAHLGPLGQIPVNVEVGIALMELLNA